jgi:hypothetical protein
MERDGVATPLPELGSIDQPDDPDAGWAHDGERGYVWVQLLASDRPATVRYAVAD